MASIPRALIFGSCHLSDLKVCQGSIDQFWGPLGGAYSVDGSFQNSGALIFTPNSRLLVMTNPQMGPSVIETAISAPLRTLRVLLSSSLKRGPSTESYILCRSFFKPLKPGSNPKLTRQNPLPAVLVRCLGASKDVEFLVSGSCALLRI